MSFPLINPAPTFTDSSGSPLASGTIEFRDPTSNAFINSYPTADDANAQTNANANPLTLNSRGEAANGLYLEDGIAYKIILKDSAGATIWTQDDVRCPVYSAASIGEAFYPQTSSEVASGITPTRYQYIGDDEQGIYHILRYAAAGETNYYTAIQNALDVANQNGGGTVIVPSGAFNYTGATSLVIYGNTKLQGNGVTESAIVYTGTSHIDVLTADPALASDIGVQIEDIQLSGGAFQTGNARYSFYATTFGRGCVLRNVWLREGLGTLYVGTGHYAQLDNVLCGPTVPTESANGCTSTQYNAVYNTTAGSFHFLGNHASLNHLTFSAFVADNDNGGTAPKTAIYLTGSPLVIDSISIEALTTSIGTPNNVITFAGGRLFISSLYAEDVEFTNYFVYTEGACQVSIEGVAISDMAGNTVFQHEGQGTIRIGTASFSTMDVNRTSHVVNSGLGLGSGVVFERTSWSSGDPLTDAAVNADTNNVVDTKDDTYKFGAAEGFVARNTYERVSYPRKLSGLVVTSGNDASGDYVQVTSGVLQTEHGEFIEVKQRTGEGVTTGLMVVWRLRPTTASKFYEVYVGQAGNLYLVQNDSATTSWYGDKLAEFDTDGSTNITNLTDNPLLSVRGQYTPGTNRAVFYVASIPTATDKRYGQGDMAIHEDVASGEVAFWIYNGSSWLAGPNMA